jgi:hypothetical protein
MDSHNSTPPPPPEIVGSLITNNEDEPAVKFVRDIVSSQITKYMQTGA